MKGYIYRNSSVKNSSSAQGIEYGILLLPQILSLQSMVGASASALSVVALNLATENSDTPLANKIEIRDVAKMAGISKAKYANFYR